MQKKCLSLYPHICRDELNKNKEGTNTYEVPVQLILLSKEATNITEMYI